MDTVRELLEDPLFQAAGIIVLSILAAWLVELLISTTLAKAAEKTKTDVDDKIIEIVRRPVFLSVLLWGLDWAAEVLTLPPRFGGPIESLLQTLIIFIWAVAGTRVGAVLLKAMAARERKKSLLQPRTLPVFDILMRIVVVASALYFMFLAWNIDLTAWLASAGILGVAFGFAAKDTLANLFAGIFILADAPYKVHDWIVLDDKLRGEVTHIGIRSTRIQTPDDVEITVPNAVIGGAQILNETGGPYVRQRVRVAFSVAYGSDVEEVRRVVLEAVDGMDDVRQHPKPRATFDSMGNSGLHFELWIWTDDPRLRELIIDQINERIYNALNRNGIEIPFPKQDVYIRQMPDSLRAPKAVRRLETTPEPEPGSSSGPTSGTG